MAQIKKDTSLRKAILQAAITGQLEISSGQCAISETGKQLLDRIIAERNAKALAEHNRKGELSHRLDFANAKSEKNKQKPETALAVSNPCDNKKTRTKKPAPIVASEIDADEIPFEIPESWCWCRLGDVSTYGSTKEKVGASEIEPDMWSLDLEDIEKDTGKILSKVLAKNRTIKGDKTRFYKGDILYSKLRPYLKKILIAPDDGICTSEIVPFCLFGDIETKYFMFFLHSPYVDNLVNSVSYGVKMPRVGTETMTNLLIPLPPLAVQKAIVAKLEEVLPLVEIYENAVLQKDELRRELSDKVKKAILQEAVTGQLEIGNGQLGIGNGQLGIGNGQCAIGETGKELLQRIIAERNAQALAEWEEKVKVNAKAKKPAPIVASEIDEDEIPFEIPENWCWVRGKNIFAPMESTKPCGESFIYIDTDAVNNKLNIIDNPKNLLVKEAPSRATRKLHKGDVLFSMVRPYLKNIAFVADEFADAIASTGFYVMTQIGMYNPKYLYYMVLSPYVIDGLHKFMKGDNSPSINTTDIDNFLFPLPPLAVQNAIVAKLEQVLPLCEHIAVSNEK